jgi:hypothetical protein
MIKLTNILREITVNKPFNIVNFLNRHKQEVYYKIVKEYLDDQEEDYKDLEFVDKTTDVNSIFKIATEKNHLQIEISFSKEALINEEGFYIEEAEIAGKKIYYFYWDD